MTAALGGSFNQMYPSNIHAQAQVQAQAQANAVFVGQSPRLSVPIEHFLTNTSCRPIPGR